MRLLGFDIEIANVFDLRPGEELEDHAPFDISVAATHIQEGEARLWFSDGQSGKPAANTDRLKARELLHYLETMQTNGHALVAWNGLSFDLRWIGHVAQDKSAAARVARKMYDPMFQFFKLKGFPVGLAAVGQGMGIKSRKLMESADAPVQWSKGNHQAVCDYVACDARMTVEIVTEIVRNRRIRWVTQRGTTSGVDLPRLRTVEECLADPMPDQSWMSTPIRQEKFCQWVLDAANQ